MLFRTIGMNKLVINHLEKVFVTSDTGTIMREMEVVHPAAKMVTLATEQQEKEACPLLHPAIYVYPAIYVSL